MNNELVIKTYNLLKKYISENENDLKKFEEMKKDRVSRFEQIEFVKKMQVGYDKFYTLRPLYMEYTKNPTKELESQILNICGEELGLIKKESSKKADENDESNEEIIEFPKLNNESDTDKSPKRESIEKKPTINNFKSKKLKGKRNSLFKRIKDKFTKKKNVSTEEKSKAYSTFDGVEKTIKEWESFAGLVIDDYNCFVDSTGKVDFGKTYNIKDFADKLVNCKRIHKATKSIKDWAYERNIEITNPKGFIDENGFYNENKIITLQEFLDRLSICKYRKIEKELSLK